jgi:hypothetical protein
VNRVGHLIQPEIFRSLHRNPRRAKVLSDLRAFDHYHWTGHAAILGTVPRHWWVTLDAIVTRVCRHVGMPLAHSTAGTRRLAATRARAGIAYRWVNGLGHPERPQAPVLEVRPQSVYQAVVRDRAARAEWDQFLGDY